MKTNDPSIQKAAAVVDDYVQRSKHWDRSVYRIEFNRKEGSALVFWVLHSADEELPYPGGGQSLELHVDPATGRIIKELGFQ